MYKYHFFMYIFAVSNLASYRQWVIHFTIDKFTTAGCKSNLRTFG